MSGHTGRRLRGLPRHLRDIALNGADLTPREREVLRLCALGLRGPEIANRLNIGTETVKTHWRGILPKLNAKTRAQAVGIAVSLDII